VRTIESTCVVRAAATTVHHSGWGVRGCVVSVQRRAVRWVVWRFGHWIAAIIVVGVVDIVIAIVCILNADIGRWIQAVYNEFTQLTTINLLSFFIDDCIKTKRQNLNTFFAAFKIYFILKTNWN
jgi:hypothetical protein